MPKIKLYNNIAQIGLDQFTPDYEVNENMEDEDAILVRSTNLHDITYNANLKAIARAGVGVNNIDIDTFKEECVSALKDGYNIIIFPTGTRTTDIKNVSLHKGSALLQIASGADILPVKIECDYPFLQKNKPIYDAGKKVINYTIEVKPEIKQEQFFETSEIKLRKVISERIKFDFTT